MKIVLKAKQYSKWRHGHPRYNRADPYYLLIRREQVTVCRLRKATTASATTYILNSKLAIQSRALAVLAVRK